MFTRSALTPLAVLSLPSVLKKSAAAPMAVLLLPVVLKKSAALPVAVLAPPVVLKKSVSAPVAVLASPVVFWASASKPNALLLRPPLPASSTLMSASVPPGGVVIRVAHRWVYQLAPARRDIQHEDESGRQRDETSD
jgi:hypothetical protein